MSRHILEGDSPCSWDKNRPRGCQCTTDHQCERTGWNMKCKEDPGNCHSACFEFVNDEETYQRNFPAGVEDTIWHHWWGEDNYGYWVDGPFKDMWYKPLELGIHNGAQGNMRFNDICTNDYHGGCWEKSEDYEKMCKQRWCNNQFIPQYMVNIIRTRCDSGTAVKDNNGNLIATIDFCANENDGGCWNDHKDECNARWCNIADADLPIYMKELKKQMCPETGETVKIIDICANPDHGGCWNKNATLSAMCEQRWCDRTYFPTYMSHNFKRLCPAGSPAKTGIIDDCAREYWNDNNDTCVEQYCKPPKTIPDHLVDNVNTHCPIDTVLWIEDQGDKHVLRDKCHDHGLGDWDQNLAECEDRYCKHGATIPNYMTDIVKQKCTHNETLSIDSDGILYDICAKANDGGCWNKIPDKCHDKYCKAVWNRPDYITDEFGLQMCFSNAGKQLDICADPSDGGCWDQNNDHCFGTWCNGDTIPDYMINVVNQKCLGPFSGSYYEPAGGGSFDSGRISRALVAPTNSLSPENQNGNLNQNGNINCDYLEIFGLIGCLILLLILIIKRLF